MRELKVNLKDLADAFDNGFDEVAYYLDLDTGEVVMVTDDARRQLEELPGVQDAETVEAVLDAIRGADIPQWEMDGVQAAAAVEWADDDRFLEIPRVESWEGYQDMEAFIETVSDEHVQEILEVAIPLDDPLLGLTVLIPISLDQIYLGILGSGTFCYPNIHKNTSCIHCTTIHNRTQHI